MSAPRLCPRCLVPLTGIPGHSSLQCPRCGSHYRLLAAGHKSVGGTPTSRNQTGDHVGSAIPPPLLPLPVSPRLGSTTPGAVTPPVPPPLPAVEANPEPVISPPRRRSRGSV